MKTLLSTSALILGLTAAPLLAADWTLNADASRLAFGSIKKNIIGEVHNFDGLSGSVNTDGVAAIEIDLASVETNIDIRNERMAEHVFKFAPKAMSTAQLDMEALSAMEAGQSEVMDVEAVLSLLGVETEFYTEVFVMRTSEKSVLVTSNDMIFLTSEELEIEEGVSKLQELAELPGITRAAPVTLRFVFEQS